MTSLNDLHERRTALDTMRPLPPEIAAAIIEWFEVELVHAGNALQGNTLSRAETERLVLDGEPPDEKPAEDILEVANHQAALDMVGAWSSPEEGTLGTDVVCRVHGVLRHRLSRDAGAFRTGPMGLGTRGTARPFVPRAMMPDHTQVPALMDRLAQWMEDLAPGPEAAAELHYRLTRIAPFHDGNLVVAVCLTNMVLGRADYPPVVIRPARRDEYYAALDRAFDCGDKAPLRRFLFERIGESLDVCIVAAAEGLSRMRKADGTDNKQ